MYEDVIVTLLGLAVAFFLMIVLVLLVYMWSRINILEKKVGSRAKGREKNQSDKTGGDLLGYRVKKFGMFCSLRLTRNEISIKLEAVTSPPSLDIWNK